MSRQLKPYFWVPTLYFVQGLPFAVINLLAEICYKDLGIANYSIAFFVSLIGLPWIIKPLWSPITEAIGTKRTWILRTQWLMVILLLVLSMAILSPHFYLLSLILFILLAFNSATYDIVSDGYYLLGLNSQAQAGYVGVRTLFYQLARLFCTGIVVLLVGWLQKYYSSQFSWMLGFSLITAILFGVNCYHAKILSNVESKKVVTSLPKIFSQVFRDFITLPHILAVAGFLLIYNAAATQLLKIVPLFLLDQIMQGGLGLSVSQVGLIFGVVGTLALLVGILLAGLLMRKISSIRILKPITLLTCLGNCGYLLLIFLQWHNLFLINSVVVLAQFGFGLATGVYMAVLMNYFSRQQFCTSFYAIGTGIMALSNLFFGMISGYLQTWMSYSWFFCWIALLSGIIWIYTILFVNRVYETS